MAELRRSPLEGVALGDGFREVPFLSQIDLRLNPADEGARGAVESVVGPLPLVPNTVHGGHDAAILWLGPDEWLVVGPPGSAADLERQLRDTIAAATDAGPVAIVDVSANRTTLELDHPDARAILAGGCSIDLHPRAFGPGRCAQTLVARAGVILWQLDDAPTYRLLVRPSFAAYLAEWLTDAIPD
ncbi:MAG: sarcosine oxidase subunit gamma [Chloroflexi bacterium]|nr:sarcosine oxidase subunit gamma [Chloroflexota bacterium]